jgi:drug/metabolite transporter (DMT)-like permease
MWFFVAIASAGLYAMAEACDNFLVNREFKHPMTLAFFAYLFSLIFVPFLFVFQHPTWPPLATIPVFIALGFVNFGYLYPYYKGLREDDTSVAISFLAIERVMVPILAFLIVGEVLNPTQYLGIIIIVASVIALGLHHARKRFRFSKGVWYITCAALFLAFEGVLLKVLFDSGVTVPTAVGGEAIMSFVFAMTVLFSRKIRKDIAASMPLFIKLFPLFFVEELLTFLGLYTESWAISHTEVSIVKAITMVSPFFLIFYAWVGRGIFPKFFREDLHRGKVIRKVILFACIIVGIVLVRGQS